MINEKKTKKKCRSYSPDIVEAIQILTVAVEFSLASSW